MRQSWQFHAIAVSIIIGIVLILYALVGPGSKPPAPAQPAPDRVIKIYSATWGRNCNQYITTENQHLLQLKLHPEQLEKMDPADRPASLDPRPFVEQDNVIAAVRAYCEGKESCDVEVDSNELKLEPLPSCYKHLEVGFRCFEFDRLHSFEVNQNDKLHIDCHASASEPAAK